MNDRRPCMGYTADNSEQMPIWRKSYSRLGALYLLGIAITCFTHVPAYAAQWTTQPEIEVGFEYDSNPRLVEDNSEDAVSAGLLNIAVDFNGLTEKSELRLRPRANIDRYSDKTELDGEDLFFDLFASTRTQKSEWSLDANFSDQRVLRGELESPEFDDTGVDEVQTGTGNVQASQDRTLFRIKPEITFSLSQRTELRLGGSYLDVSYDPELINRAIDYNEGQVRAAVGYQASPTGNIQFALYSARFESGDDANETTSNGVTIKYDHNVTERSNAFIEAGYEEAEIEIGAMFPLFFSESYFLWSVGASRQWTNSEFRIVAGMATTPSGAGFVKERQRVRASFRHKLSPRLSASFSIITQSTDTLATDSDFGDRDYTYGRIGISYRMTPSWSLYTSAGYADQDDKDEPGSANSTTARVSIVYRPPVQTP